MSLEDARDWDETNTGVLPEFGLNAFFLKKNQILVSYFSGALCLFTNNQTFCAAHCYSSSMFRLAAKTRLASNIKFIVVKYEKISKLLNIPHL